MRASEWFSQHDVLPAEFIRRQHMLQRELENQKKHDDLASIEEYNRKSDRNRRRFWIVVNTILFFINPVAGAFLLPITLLNAAFS